MQRAAIVSGVLGLGSVLVFAAAALAAALFPNGGTVSAFNQFGTIGRGGVAMPAPMPAIEPGVIVDDGKDDFIVGPQPVEDR
ncbi:MAG TPA: hypothetical protein VFL03_08030 [Candidatus Limnocylindrales bacterium]|jgi:hypothetical protein|nr:hypothetical protein [Candidatus Limnocylindrales bacterium]